MVAGYVTKRIPCYLVRVPGSGQGQGATAVVCDLGRVSSLAASVTVSPSLSAIIRPQRAIVPPTSTAVMNKLAATEVLDSQQCRLANTTRKRSRTPSDDAKQESKRLRLDVSSPSTTSSSNNHSRAVGVNVHSSQSQEAAASVVVHAAQGRDVSATTKRPATGKKTLRQLTDIYKALDDLQQERNRLQEENRELTQRLSSYLRFCQGRGISVGVLLPVPPNGKQ